MSSLKEAQSQAANKENPFKPAKGPSPTHPRSRKGKTARDRANGQTNKNYENKQMRASWQSNPKDSFPASSCNGKRNRYQWTGKDGETVYAGVKRK